MLLYIIFKHVEEKAIKCDSCFVFYHVSQRVRESSGPVVECLTREVRVAGLSLTGSTALCPLASHIYPGLVLFQPRKTRPDITKSID